MKRHLLYALLLLSFLPSCGRKEEKDAAEETEYEFHAFAGGGNTVSTYEMPPTWDYSYSPNYCSGIFFKTLQKWEEVDWGEDYFIFGDGGGVIRFRGRGDRNELLDGEEFVFDDGEIGLRMWNDKFGVHREQIYYPKTQVYIFVSADAQTYTEHEEEVQHFLKSYSAGMGGVSAEGLTAGQKDSKERRLCHFHMYAWSLQVDLTLPEGFYVEWEGSPEGAWGYWEEYGEETEYLHLFLDEERENTVIVGVRLELPDDAESVGEPYACTLASGMKGVRQDFVKDGKKGLVCQNLAAGLRDCDPGRQDGGA
ncbi:MAG: hypothetical protein K2N94_15900 [Lachnospiraceae bacterium]|nr:hypothetical protein [Lachnospiraceae bacterium]